MLKDQSVSEFLSLTASNEPVPGGGSIAAHSGATAAALIEMVANLTRGKKKYADVEFEMIEIADQAKVARLQLLDAIQKDADAFDQVMDAFKMPKASDEEKAIRKKAIHDATIHAMEVPLEVALTIESLFPLAKTLVLKGNKNAITDAAVATMHIRTGILSALYNVKINLAGLEMNPVLETTVESVNALEASAHHMEKEILDLVVLS
jgi:formiminotetrahydrofolate cyclodeaminase